MCYSWSPRKCTPRDVDTVHLSLFEHRTICFRLVVGKGSGIVLTLRCHGSALHDTEVRHNPPSLTIERYVLGLAFRKGSGIVPTIRCHGSALHVRWIRRTCPRRLSSDLSPV